MEHIAYGQNKCLFVFFRQAKCLMLLFVSRKWLCARDHSPNVCLENHRNHKLKISAKQSIFAFQTNDFLYVCLQACNFHVFHPTILAQGIPHKILHIMPLALAQAFAPSATLEQVSTVVPHITADRRCRILPFCASKCNNAINKRYVAQKRVQNYNKDCKS